MYFRSKNFHVLSLLTPNATLNMITAITVSPINAPKTPPTTRASSVFGCPEEIVSVSDIKNYTTLNVLF